MHSYSNAYSNRQAILAGLVTHAGSTHCRAGLALGPTHGGYCTHRYPCGLEQCTPITSMAECQLAATSLGFSDRTASSDGQAPLRTSLPLRPILRPRISTTVCRICALYGNGERKQKHRYEIRIAVLCAGGACRLAQIGDISSFSIYVVFVQQYSYLV